MARNIEIKARVADLDAIAAAARRLGAEGPVEILQDDSFFACQNGRLKLRAFVDGSGELIFYRRADQAGPKESFYLRSRTPDPDVLRESLALAWGTAGRVRKRRLLYLLGRTRIHLDQVQGLGAFVELEVVLREGESAQDGVSEAHRLMEDLSIERSQLCEGAYVDLLQQQATPALPQALKDSLAARHREPGRHYHGMAHVEALLRWLDQSRDLAADPRAIEAAIWFHDAVYDTRSTRNEAESAQLARRELTALQWPAPAIDKVEAMVLATAGHATDGEEDADLRLFLDLDLSILGQPAPVYAAYSAAIRAEYRHVEEAAYKAGRRRVLQSFLARPAIFHTRRWHEAWEAQARTNMRQELDALGGD